MSDWATKDTPRPTTFIQWKGTDVCMDVYCICGEQYHIDGMFAHATQCPHCKRSYEMSTRLEMREIPDIEVWDGCPILLGSDDDY